jgi:hypothetical protein
MLSVKYPDKPKTWQLHTFTAPELRAYAHDCDMIANAYRNRKMRRESFRFRHEAIRCRSMAASIESHDKTGMSTHYPLAMVPRLHCYADNL